MLGVAIHLHPPALPAVAKQLLLFQPSFGKKRKSHPKHLSNGAEVLFRSKKHFPKPQLWGCKGGGITAQ